MSIGHSRIAQGVALVTSCCVLLALSACSTSGAASPQPPRADAAAVASRPPAQVPPLDAALHEVGVAFARQLHERVNGRLLALTEQDGVIASRWSSETCDWSEPEMIDLIESVHSSYQGEVSRIEGVRECGGVTRRYVLSGRGFSKYQLGQVTNPDVLRFLIEATTETGPAPVLARSSAN